MRSAFVRTIYCFFFFFYLFGSETYVKLILDQMVSTTKSTRFVSCDCSRQIHHARLLPFILFIERFSKDRSRSRVHRRNHPLREKEKKGKEIYLPLLHLYLLFRKTILTFYTSSERIGEKEGTAGSWLFVFARREKSRKGIVLQLRSLN